MAVVGARSNAYMEAQTMTYSTKRLKPQKPYPDFPLFPHAAGVWAKKIKGKLHYFGKWADWQAALRRYLDEKDALFAGRTPSPGPGGVAIRELLSRFLTAKAQLLDGDELTLRTFADYKTACNRVKDQFGLDRRITTLAAEDFEKFRDKLAEGWGPVTLGNCLGRVRVLFKYAFDSGLIEKPVRFGPMFRMPSRRALRKARLANGERVFEADELRRIIDAARMPMRAMVLLGANCGFGNADCGAMPLAALHLDAGWVRFPRPKTGIDRRCPLWPETVAAIRGTLMARPKPKDPGAEGRLFVTHRGAAWNKAIADNPIAKAFAKVLRTLGLQRKGRGFYALRHTFETIAGESRDQVAVNFIVGHTDESTAATCRGRISDDRLVAVVEYVRKWLFGEQEAK
jgi:integrase